MHAKCEIDISKEFFEFIEKIEEKYF